MVKLTELVKVYRWDLTSSADSKTANKLTINDIKSSSYTTEQIQTTIKIVFIDNDGSETVLLNRN